MCSPRQTLKQQGLLARETRLLELRLCIRPVAVDDPPLPANPAIDLGTIPARQHGFLAVSQFPVIDEIQRQQRYVAMVLDFGCNHFRSVDP